MENETVQDTKEVWVVIGNKDNTEGRGPLYVMHVCEIKVTALRLSEKKGVMGSDAPIEKRRAVKVNNRWYYPGNLIEGSSEDYAENERIAEKEKLEQRLKQAGFADHEINQLKC